MGKETKLAMFIPGDTPPELGFAIDWHDTYLAAVGSTELFSGYFKANSSGGLSNIMVFGDPTKPIPNPDYPQNPPNPEDEVPEFLFVPNDIPVDEIDISDSASFSSVWTGLAPQVRVTGNILVSDVSGLVPLKVLSANGTAIKTIPAMEDNATVRMDGNGLVQAEVDAIVNSFLIYDDSEPPLVTGARPGMILENDGNVDADLTNAGLIAAAGGHVWETDRGFLRFLTTASVATGFTFFINAGADVDWYENNVLAASNTNNHTFFFTDASVKEIAIRGGDVADGQWMSMTGKSLTGIIDLGAMVGAAARIDFSDNPNVTEVILPMSTGIMDQCMAYNTGITTLRLDKLPGLVNSASIQIRMGDCPNLDTDSVVRNILAIDTNLVTGRQFWTNGTTPNMDPALKVTMQAQNWTVVE